MEIPSNLSRLSPKSKWIIAGCVLLILVALGSIFYGLTQRSIKKEKTLQEQYQSQLMIEKERTETINKQMVEQSRAMQTQQARMDSLITSSMNTNKDREESTIRTIYMPGTDKVTERIETRVTEREISSTDSKNETHSVATATTVVETTATATVATAVTEKERATETMSATTTVTTKTDIAPVARKARDMRFTIGAAYHDNKIKPVAGYSVKAFGIGQIISIGPGIIVGDDLLGGALQADILDLPRIGAGYGCSFGGKLCGLFYSIGVKLEF